MSLSLLPTAVYAEKMNAQSVEGAQIAGDYAALEPDSEAMAAQAMISALPTLQNLTAADYDVVQDAYDAYSELTEAQQAQISGAEIFEALFVWFNEQTMPLATCPPHVVTTSYGTCDICYQSVPHETDYTWYTDPSAAEFTLNDAKQLKAFANIVNGTDLPSGTMQTDFSGKIIKLGSDIDQKVIGSVEYTPDWMPIGKADAAFAGTFDGGNHSIINLKSQSYSGYVGLFGFASNQAIIRDLTVEGAVEGTIAGGIVGSTHHCAIEKYANYATINATDSNAAAGGIVGYAADALLLKNCYNRGSIRDGGFDIYNVGGLAGCIGADSQNCIKQIERCYSIGTVTSEMGNKGALIGKFENGSDNTATMSCCYYLSGTTAAFGTTAPSACTAISISETQFKSGEIAWSLQDHTQKEMIWGQRLSGADPDSYPIFSKNTVYQVKFMDRTGTSCYTSFTKYMNSGDTIDALPTPNPAPSGFAGWNTEKNNGGTRFTTAMPITKNTILYVREGHDAICRNNGALRCGRHTECAKYFAGCSWCGGDILLQSNSLQYRRNAVESICAAFFYCGNLLYVCIYRRIGGI